MDINNIPLEVLRLALDATSPRNDGYTAQAAKDKLLKIRNYINEVLENK